MNMRHSLQFLTILLLLLAGGMSLSQERDAPAEQDAQDEETAVTVLEFTTYDCAWLRYKNWNAWGGRKLAIEGYSLFPFRHLVGENMPELADLEAADTLAEQLALYGEIDESATVYDEERLAGECDADKLKGDYKDLFCVPGTSEMPDGLVSLAVYHPEDAEIVALTTVIDNRDGGATDAGCWRPPTPAPALQDPSPGCGPYVPGQWITAEEYAASGLNLPVSAENTQFPILHYTCMVPQGAPSYLQAHPLIQPTAMPTPMPTPEPESSRPQPTVDDGAPAEEDEAT